MFKGLFIFQAKAIFFDTIQLEIGNVILLFSVRSFLKIMHCRIIVTGNYIQIVFYIAQNLVIKYRGKAC